MGSILGPWAVILLANQPTNGHRRKHNLLGGDNYEGLTSLNVLYVCNAYYQIHIKSFKEIIIILLGNIYSPKSISFSYGSLIS